MKLVEGRQRQGEGAPSHYVYSEVNQRENNEDSFHMYGLYLPASQQTLTILSIADGMGGHAWGEHVSRETLHRVSLALFEQLNVDRALNVLEQEPAIDIDQLVQAIESAIKEANAHVLNMIRNNNWRRAGSTIAVVAILENTAVVVNLGDSPVFHYESKSECLNKVTIDHTVTNRKVREGKITAEMARYHSGRSILDLHIGKENLPARLDACTFELEEGDLLLLCTDGISAPLSEQQIAAILSAPHTSLRDIAHRLIEAAQQTGETDNQTLFLWQHRMAPDKQKEESRMVKEANNVDTVKIAGMETRLAFLEEAIGKIQKRLTAIEAQLYPAEEAGEKQKTTVDSMEKEKDVNIVERTIEVVVGGEYKTKKKKVKTDTGKGKTTEVAVTETGAQGNEEKAEEKE